MSYLPIEETDVYKRACDLADRVYAGVAVWGILDKDTVGKQLIRAADSIGANLVEGDGRRSDIDSSRYFRYARSSAREARHWIRTARRRDCLASQEADFLVEEVTELARMISGLLRHRASAQVRENRSAYDDPFADS